MTPAEQSRAIIEQMAPRLKAEGYTIVYEPPQQLLPPFMGNYVPDAIALGSGKKIAIEVLVEGDKSVAKQRDLQELFKNAPDWELYFYFVRPGEAEHVWPVSLEAIDQSIHSIQQLSSERALAPALLMSWATFEALARVLAPEKYRKPQTPGRLVETLARSGHVTPTEADFLRAMAHLRNELVHGNLEVQIKFQDLERLIEALQELRKQATDGDLH